MSCNKIQSIKYIVNNKINNTHTLNSCILLSSSGTGDASYILGRHYYHIKQYALMKTYYTVAISQGNYDAAYMLALYYRDICNEKLMNLYIKVGADHGHGLCQHLIAANKGDIYSSHELFKYYKKTNQLNEMIKYITSFNDIELDEPTKRIILSMPIISESLKTSLIDMFLIRKELSFVYTMCKKHNIINSKISSFLQILDNKMKISIIDECPICYNNTNLIIYECFGHYYCLNCIFLINKCAVCRIIPIENSDDSD
jgi:hypothetical protein